MNNKKAALFVMAVLIGAGILVYVGYLFFGPTPLLNGYKIDPAPDPYYEDIKPIKDGDRSSEL